MTFTSLPKSSIVPSVAGVTPNAAPSVAQAEPKPKLAQALRELAAEKDALADAQLEASGQLRGPEESVAAALAEERYENESLYPRMAGEVDDATAHVFAEVVAKQKEHESRFESLLDQLSRSKGDLGA